MFDLLYLSNDAMCRLAVDEKCLASSYEYSKYCS